MMIMLPSCQLPFQTSMRSENLPPNYMLKERLGKAKHSLGKQSIIQNDQSRLLIPR